MPLGSWLVVALSVQSPTADSLLLLAGRGSDSALAAEALAHPLVLREALSQALARAVRTPARADAELAAARRLAAAHATAWRDSFLVREVARFAAWSPERRAARTWADSVRRAGVAAFSRDGPRAAILVWRRAFVRARAIPDTAGSAAVLGNIGQGLQEEGRLDSAEWYLERARTLAIAVGDVRVEANAAVGLADLHAARADPAGARERYARALTLHARIGDTRGEAADHNNLGLLAQTNGDLDEARRQFEAALALNREGGRATAAATNLVNLAGLASLAGDFARAEAAYREALSTWREREEWAEAASALHGLGQLELRRGDYPAAREALTEALAIYERTGPLARALAVRRSLADALAAAGELQSALDELRRAQRQADASGAPSATRAGIALARADLAVQLNALAEAERLYDRAVLLYRQAGDPTGEAEARQGLGALYLARDDRVRAQANFVTALRTQQAAGNQRSAALTRLLLGGLLRDRGDTTAARRQLAQAAADLSRLGDPVAAAAALGERAALEGAAGMPAAADSLYRAGLAQMEGRVSPEIAWRLHAGLALTLRSRGSPEEAVRELRAAIVELERPGRTLGLPERRSGYLADKWDVYAQLALTERARGRMAAAFEASERLRAREMAELLARGRVRSPPDTAVDLVAREQDLRRRIGELTSAMQGAGSGSEAVRGPDVSLGGEVTREALLRAQDDYAALLLEIRERAPRLSALLPREPAAWPEVARRLAPGDALVEYLVSDSASLAFVVTSDTLAVVDLGITHRDLARLVELARGTLEGEALRADSVWRGPLRRLHRYLIAPLEEAHLLAGASRLVIVPHAELHYLPFAALLDGEGRGHFLIERYELSYAPSASVWLALGDRRRFRTTSGVLAFAPRPDALRATREEVATVVQLMGGEALTGHAATEGAFRRLAPSRRVLHLATYGVLNKQNPLFSFIELAPGGADDGRLEVHEVFDLDLAADLVVLSACQTGLGSGVLADVPPGDDWVGLTRAFLHAGAANVVATLWPVDDRASAALMERFYTSFAGDADPARALARAQRALLQATGTAHPFYWAGFVSTGVGSARPVDARAEGR